MAVRRPGCDRAAGRAGAANPVQLFHDGRTAARQRGIGCVDNRIGGHRVMSPVARRKPYAKTWERDIHHIMARAEGSWGAGCRDGTLNAALAGHDQHPAR